MFSTIGLVILVLVKLLVEEPMPVGRGWS